MRHKLTFKAISAEHLTTVERTEIINLCSAAYEENFDQLFKTLPGSTHLLASLDGALVSHAAWVIRWLQPQGQELLRTAYVEAVATAPSYQGRGFGTALMREMRAQIGDYELGALSPSEVVFYERFGWERWRGPLAIRTEKGLVATPCEEVMILRLARTPNLDLNAGLTAEWRSGELW